MSKGKGMISYPVAMGHITLVPTAELTCGNCGSCEVVCSTVHEGACSPSLRRIWVKRDPFHSVYLAETCQHSILNQYSQLDQQEAVVFGKWSLKDQSHKEEANRQACSKNH